MTNYDKMYSDLSIEALREESKAAEEGYKNKLNKLCDAQGKSDLRLMERYHNSLAEICARLQALTFILKKRQSKTKANIAGVY